MHRENKRRQGVDWSASMAVVPQVLGLLAILLGISLIIFRVVELVFDAAYKSMGTDLSNAQELSKTIAKHVENEAIYGSPLALGLFFGGAALYVVWSTIVMLKLGARLNALADLAGLPLERVQMLHPHAFWVSALVTFSAYFLPSPFGLLASLALFGTIIFPAFWWSQCNAIHNRLYEEQVKATPAALPPALPPVSSPKANLATPVISNNQPQPRDNF